MIDTKFKVQKVITRNAEGVLEKKFIPLRKVTFWGIGFWRQCPEWEGIEKRMVEEKFLGMDSDSTITHIQTFIDKNDPNPRNEYYNE